jgi:4-hydroxyacetophenone monooxygenase
MAVGVVMASKHAEHVLQVADMRVLLMALFHLTGDSKWISPPFVPQRDVRLVAQRDAGLSEDAQNEIREQAAYFIDNGFPVAAITDPGDEVMAQMMRVCMGENVTPEYAPMMREELGFASRDEGLAVDAIIQHRNSMGDPHVLIIGAGVSGIALGAQLTRLGISYVILDSNDEVGGTWYRNRYPGCGVDTPNHAYSFSTGRRNQWTRYFSLRTEIQDYVVSASREFGVHEHVIFEREVIAARWEEGDQRWYVSARCPDGSLEEFVVPVVVSAIGGLSVPSVPELPGVDSFEGPLFHSFYWPEDLDVSGKRVAIIGTGASAMQIATTVAPLVEKLTIYQRSPQWARDIKGYRDLIDEGELWLLDHFPFYAEWFRFTMFWRYGDGLLATLRKDPEWPHLDRSMNKVNERHRVEMVKYIESIIGNRADLMEKCMPTYPPYGKRILLDNGWYEMLLRENVELITEGVQRIDSRGVVSDEMREADVVVMATGFDVHQFLGRIDVTGRNGVALADSWGEDDPRAYLGLTVTGFPNLFMMSGPNTFLAHGGSLIFMAECQSRYISGAIIKMLESSVTAIDVDEFVMDEYCTKVDEEHEQLIWTHPGMNNWYRNEKGRVTAVLPWRLVDYWALSHDPDLKNFHVTKNRGNDAYSSVASSRKD